ncbi:MAG: hypothetical protein KJO50_06005 [Bacteroidia bacterium]|nr:hypothetical protein [Bacteroidia bacterium]MBT8229796.1 hypothetical protein [Bacteroidia bacterium]
MAKYILESVSQINWMGIVPLLIFFTFFVIMLISVLKKDKSYIRKMENLPLEKD